MEAGDADVGKRQLGRRALTFQCLAGQFDSLHRVAGPLQLPVAATEVNPRLRRLGGEPQLVQAPNRIDQQLLSGRRLAVEPAKTAHPVEEQGTVVRI